MQVFYSHPACCSSHWFLAVVCFPGLGMQDYISYQPTVSSCGEEGGAAGDSEVSHSAYHVKKTVQSTKLCLGCVVPRAVSQHFAC